MEMRQGANWKNIGFKTIHELLSLSFTFLNVSVENDFFYNFQMKRSAHIITLCKLLSVIKSSGGGPSFL